MDLTWSTGEDIGLRYVMESVHGLSTVVPQWAVHASRWGSHNSNFTGRFMVDIPNYFSWGLCEPQRSHHIDRHHLADTFSVNVQITSAAPSTPLSLSKNFRTKSSGASGSPIVLISFKRCLPSGNDYHSYWKWPFRVDFPTIDGDFP